MFKCKYCGRSHARGKQHCPAADAQCTNCQKMGHFGSVCFQKKSWSIARAVEEDEPVTNAGEELNHVYDTVYVVGDSRHSNTFATTLTVNGKQCKGLLDTGATRTLITEDIVSASRPSPTLLKAYDGNTVMTLGVADVIARAGDKFCSCTCFVVPAGRTVLFGQDVITKLQFLLPVEVNMVRITPVDIMVDPRAIPVALPPRRHAFSLRGSIEAELKRLQENNIIEPVQEATSWVSPLVPVRKANGTLRQCVDYRLLNKSIVRERHKMPTVDEIPAMLDGAKVFSVLDATGCHWLSDQGVLPDTNKMLAIQDMLYPESVTDVRRFLGMATYLGKFIPHLSRTTDSLRRLAKRDPFVVNQELQDAFNDAKKGITLALQR